jgi:adenylate kinase family enzyme
MCCLSFSGKTTLARKIANRIGAVHISLDTTNEERELYGGEAIAPEEWGKTSHLAAERAREHLF